MFTAGHRQGRFGTCASVLTQGRRLEDLFSVIAFALSP